MEMETLGGSVMVMTQSEPHALQNITDVLTLVAFAFLCYAVYRVFRLPQSRTRAWALGLMTALLAVATLFDAIIEHRVVITFHSLYLSQVSFAAVIIAVSLGLRGESLRVERELQRYRTHMDELVEARVRELDEAHARLAEEERVRVGTEDLLRRRVEELNTLQRIAEIFGGRATLEQALDEVTGSAARLFQARYARVTLLPGDDEAGKAPAGREAALRAGGDDAAGTPLDQEVSAAALREGAMIASPADAWPGLSDEARRAAADDGLGAILAHPLVATTGPIGVFLVVRDAGADAFSDEEGRLARTMGDALAAVIEIDRLHRQETQQALAEERQALARDLHDAVTQSIYSATLIAEALPAVYERDPDEGMHNLERLRRLVRAALAEMRTLLFELRPAALQTAPLDVLVERLGDALSGQTDLSVDLRVDEDLDLPPDVKVVFYRVTQEAFSNIAKHARASAVSARVEADSGGGDQVTLTVTDDGRGFDPTAVPEGHMGLHIMAERLEGVRAEFSVRSAPGAGTTVTAIWRRTASDRRPLERMQA
jgi:signal transduction histidine kinase